MMKSRSEQPIGLFDSGVGGLTVVKEIMRGLPNESLVYFGDTARLPYGTKSPETIIQYSIENADFLLTHNIKLLVIPCNTATAHAEEILQTRLPIPVIGVIKPGAEKAISVTKQNRIGVLATTGTIRSEAYQKELNRLRPNVHVVPIACPLFVPLVEEKFVDHAATRLIIKEYLKPLTQNPVDTLLLGCTHYPLLKDLIQDEVGYDVTLVDSATSCSEQVATKLQEINSAASGNSPRHRFFVSDDPEKFHEFGKKIIGLKFDKVQKV